MIFFDETAVGKASDEDDFVLGSVISEEFSARGEVAVAVVDVVGEGHRLAAIFQSAGNGDAEDGVRVLEINRGEVDGWGGIWEQGGAREIGRGRSYVKAR